MIDMSSNNSTLSPDGLGGYNSVIDTTVPIVQETNITFTQCR